MRALIVATLVLAGATAAYHARAGEPPAAIPLWRAARDGKVSVHGGSTGSYSQAQVTIQNRTDGELSVDVNGSYLMPLGDYQRLGLGLLQKGSSVTEVTLPRGASATVTVLSVCMDVHKHSPDTSTRFSLASVAAPTPIHRALEQWKKSPELDQSSVQCAVWNTEPAQVRAGQKNAKGQIISGLPEATHKVAVCDGVVYALVGPGELMAAAPGAEFQPVAQDVEDVVACEGAVHALFRVAPAAVTSGTRERRYCVSRLENRTWTEEVTVAKLGRLEWATSGIAILALGAELDLLTGKPGGRAAVSRSIGKATDQLVPVKGGALVLTPSNDAARITRLAVQDGKADVKAQDLDIGFKSIAVWEGVILGATARGDLIRVNEDLTLKNVQFLLDRAGAAQTGAITRKARSLRNVPAGVLVELEDGFFVLGADKSLSEIMRPPLGATLVVDPTTHQLYAHAAEELRRLDGGWHAVEFVQTAPAVADAPDVAVSLVASETVAATSTR